MSNRSCPPSTQPLGLDRDFCLQRQDRLRQALQRCDLDAGLIRNRRHVHYFTGYWGPSIAPTAVLVPLDGPTTLAIGFESECEPAADQIKIYPSNKLATLIDDMDAAMADQLSDDLGRYKALGCDLEWPLGSQINHEARSIVSDILALRRAKDDDEVQLIRRAVSACEAAYARARAMLEPGVTEIQVYAQMYAAAVEVVGEIIGEVGQDFRAGVPGGPPRPCPVEAGQLMPLDVSIRARGYGCDLCRTFAVDGRPTEDQQRAHGLVVAALEHVEAVAGPGVSCKQLYQDVAEMIDGKHGWSFFHHLGHGIGLGVHEAPRLNPHWADTLEPGDVFTVEPGLYHPEQLRGGVRLEHNYLVTESGLDRLSQYPLDL